LKGFSEPIPRKGTETVCLLSLALGNRCHWFFRTYSPQGDGNDGTAKDIKKITRSSGFSEPIPRKGTETQSTLSFHLGVIFRVFQNLFPARGRKHQLLFQLPRWFFLQFFRTYSPQGDGNTGCTKIPVPYLFFRTYSPQGDGNKTNRRSGLGAKIKPSFSEPIPRKGTETSPNEYSLGLFCCICFSEPIPRKGTETQYTKCTISDGNSMFFRTYSPQGDGNIRESFIF